jgi:tRNA (guanine-N7-)-methyltransferase
MPPPLQSPHGPLRSYGRIKSRTIKPRQADLLARRQADLMLPDPEASPIDPNVLAPGAAEVWLEIGFGGGEHMAEQAQRRPDVLVLGAEPFLNGVASAVRHVDERGLTNVRLLQGDARALLAALPAAGLDRVFILFPDPWPKTRHHKRRLIQAEVVAELARALKPGGRLRFATDWADYADWALRRFLASPYFSWTAERADDWRTPPADHVTTRYEEKRLGDCEPTFLDFDRSEA